MTFHGLPLTTLLWLFAVCTAVILALYRLRVVRRIRVVAALETYRTAFATNGQKHRTVIRRISIALQLLIALCLIVALGEPAQTRKPTASRRVLIVLDNSASMQTLEHGKTRLDLGKNRVRRYLETLPSDVEVGLATTNRNLSAVLSPTSDREALQSALTKIDATTEPSQVELSLRDLSELLRPGPTTEVVWTTDNTVSAFENVTLPDSLTKHRTFIITVGSHQDNLALLRFGGRRLHHASHQVALAWEVGNFSKTTQGFVCDIDSNNTLTHREEGILQPNERKWHFLTVQLSEAAQMHARIRSKAPSLDALTVDNDAYVTLPAARKSHLVVRSTGDLYLEAALLAIPWLTFDAQHEKDFRADAPCDALILNNGKLPEQLRCPTLWLNPDPDSAYVNRNALLHQVGFDTWDKEYAPFIDLELFDVQVQKAFTLKPLPSDRILAKSGNSPLMVLSERNKQPLIILGFSPSDSDFVLRPAWPLFVEQVVSMLLAATPVDDLTSPQPSRRARDAESRIAVAPKPPLGVTPLTPENLPRYSPPWAAKTWLMIAALVLLIVEWVTFHRRVTQ